MGKLVVEKPYKREDIVVCGYCKGAGVHYKTGEVCDKCCGKKILKRVNIGSVKVYSID